MSDQKATTKSGTIAPPSPISSGTIIITQESGEGEVRERVFPYANGEELIHAFDAARSKLREWHLEAARTVEALSVTPEEVKNALAVLKKAQLISGAGGIASTAKVGTPGGKA